MTQGANNTQFWFGAGRERVIQQHSDGTKTIYVGALYEVVSHSGGLTEYKHYIMTPIGRTAVRTVRSDAKVEARYFHQDALGSIYAATDEGGFVEERYTFDPWGKRVNTADTHATGSGQVTRGFTDHEMLDDFGLVHMNGRIYDPLLGRFLSADVVVQFPGNLQSFNRYSYVQNNPLTFKDETGQVIGPIILGFAVGAATDIGFQMAVNITNRIISSMAVTWFQGIARKCNPSTRTKCHLSSRIVPQIGPAAPLLALLGKAKGTA